jgi:hypothetical protein
MLVVRVARKRSTSLDRIAAAREYCDTVPALLSVPNCTVASGSNRKLREALARRLELLEASHVGLRLAQPTR